MGWVGVGWGGGWRAHFHRAFKNDLHTPWPHSAQSPETLMETIWEFWVIWQAAYLAPAPPFSTHSGGEWANRTQKAFYGRVRARSRARVAREGWRGCVCALRTDSAGKTVKGRRVRWELSHGLLARKTRLFFPRGSHLPERERPQRFTTVNIGRKDLTSKLQGEKKQIKRPGGEMKVGTPTQQKACDGSS